MPNILILDVWTKWKIFLELKFAGIGKEFTSGVSLKIYIVYIPQKMSNNPWQESFSFFGDCKIEIYSVVAFAQYNSARGFSSFLLTWFLRFHDYNFVQKKIHYEQWQMSAIMGNIKTFVIRLKATQFRSPSVYSFKVKDFSFWKFSFVFICGWVINFEHSCRAKLWDSCAHIPVSTFPKNISGFVIEARLGLCYRGSGFQVCVTGNLSHSSLIMIVNFPHLATIDFFLPPVKLPFYPNQLMFVLSVFFNVSLSILRVRLFVYNLSAKYYLDGTRRYVLQQILLVLVQFIDNFFFCTLNFNIRKSNTQHVKLEQEM